MKLAFLACALSCLPAAAAEEKEKPMEVATAAPLMTLGAGDAVNVQVYGRPELTTTTYVTDDGTIEMPLTGAIPVMGLSPAKAGQRVASAFQDGQFLRDPHVTVMLVQVRSQQVTVLGAVHTPGRFVIESRSTVLDVLALAGGTTEAGGDVVTVLRPERNGSVTKYQIDLRGLTQPGRTVPKLALRGGDSIFVPVADQFYLNGEVHAPNMYRLEAGMTVMQAISRGGGATPRGSSSRVEIKRRNADGKYVTLTPKPGDLVKANDVIRVKERIF